jgi:hypothetical protein
MLALTRRSARSPIAERIGELFPGAQLLEVQPLRPDGGDDKAMGYGRPSRVRVRMADGSVRTFVLHFESANDFGHDRRADRAANALLAYDTFAKIPGHVRAMDVGAAMSDGRLLSLRQAGELWVLTEWAEGEPYATDLRAIAARGVASALDEVRCDALVRAIALVHAERGTHPGAYVRAIRDLVGHGEGIAGLADGYPDATPAAPRARLEAIERACLEWRFRLRGRTERLRRTHGDFHPFNVVFDPGATPTLLDASRGGQGEPADDVTCLAINYVFFALQAPASWRRGFGPLWRRFWRGYLEATTDLGVLDAAPPFLAWRALVLSNPRWYPGLAPTARDALLGFVERALSRERFDVDSAEALFP